MVQILVHENKLFGHSFLTNLLLSIILDTFFVTTDFFLLLFFFRDLILDQLLKSMINNNII